MEAQRLIVICLAGVSSGAVLGAFLRAEMEIDRRRRGRQFWSPFQRRSVSSMLLNNVIKLMFTGLIVLCGLVTLHIGDVRRLTKSGMQSLALA